MSTLDILDIYIDGSSLGNPGDSGIGVIFNCGSETIKNLSRYIGVETNNVAEYTALTSALQEALIMKAKTIRIHSDSELLCRQLKGEYKVKSQNLKNLYTQAVSLIRGFESVVIKQIPREQNSGADKLARLAASEHKSKTGRMAARH